MSSKQLRQRQNGRTAPPSSTSSGSQVPSDKTKPEGAQLGQDPQYGRMAFHLGCAGAMIYGFQSLTDIAVGHVVEPQYGGFFQYLTINGLFATIVCLVFCAAQDSFPHRPVFVPIRRALLLFAMPIEVVISSIYWSIVLTKPGLMFPPAPPSTAQGPSSSSETLLFRIPLWMDISMHLLPAVALAIHFFLLEKRYTPPASTAGATTLAVSFGAVYSIWVEHCAKQNGRFPYPFLNVMSMDERMAMYVGSTVLALVAFWGLNALHR